MAQSKALPKERYNRQRRARSVRRTLASISPSNSHHQRQSPLFSILPAEVRLLIFQHVLSQTHNLSRPFPGNHIAPPPLYRPSHTFATTTSTTLLKTCRLIYYEARAIPLRSATHHFGLLDHNMSSLDIGDIWLHHMTKQRAAELYHLHDSFVLMQSYRFKQYLLPHLMWKRVTWTICTWVWPAMPAGQGGLEDLVEILQDVVLPQSCHEVTLELDMREDLGEGDRAEMWEEAEKCRRLALVRTDGSKLKFDDELALQYMWVGRGLIRKKKRAPRVQHKTIRLCWRAGVARREYTSYDWLQCLGLEESVDVRQVALVDWKEAE